MWNRLVEAKRWDICSRYLDDAEARYKVVLKKFDESIELCITDPSLGGQEFAQQIKRWYVLDAGHLLGALQNTGRLDAASQLAATVASDMKSRGHPELAAQVGERAAL